ncbi:MAG: hypothetical protein WAU36_01500 [Cyclobacteriaceae bacterium]
MFYRNAYLYFIIAALVTVVAFIPSYFIRLSQTDTAHHFHGITATLWLLLLIAQPLLYRKKLLKLHRQVGKISFILVPLVVVGGLTMVHQMMLAKANYPPQLPYQLAFIDFFSLAGFILFFVLAIVHRKNLQLHARYMVCTVLGPLIPALTRFLFLIPWINNFNKSLNMSYVLIELVLLLLLFDDKRSGKIRSPYIIAIVLFILQHVLMNFAKEWDWWLSAMDSFSRL